MHQDIDSPKLLRKALADGHTTAGLGRLIGLSQPSVSRLARGVSQPPKSMTVGLRLVRVAGGVVELPQEKVAPKDQGHAA